MHQRQRGPRSCFLPIAIVAVAAFTACTNNNSGSPDQIRQRTAEATETVRQDAKAIAEGVKEGMASDHKAININKASREDLLTLPGLNDRAADRIIADRPFENVHDLVTKRIVSQSEYDQIRDRVIAGH
jgi:DNA uptake protein ComE-like DNA-binding protein